MVSTTIHARVYGSTTLTLSLQPNWAIALAFGTPVSPGPKKEHWKALRNILRATLVIFPQNASQFPPVTQLLDTALPVLEVSVMGRYSALFPGIASILGEKPRSQNLHQFLVLAEHVMHIKRDGVVVQVRYPSISKPMMPLLVTDFHE